MAFRIKNPETDRLARRVAAAKGAGLTEAVQAALEHHRQREQELPSLMERVAEFRKKLLARGNPKRGKPADKGFYDDLSDDV